MFKIHKEELEVNGKKLTLETGKIARQADGAIIASLAGSSESVFDTSSIFGFLAIVLAAINIFGGFLVTQRMLQMYKKKKDKKK